MNIRLLETTGAPSLTYALAAKPSPLQVGLERKQRRAELQLVITNQLTAAVTVHSITFTVLVGAGPDALTNLTSASLDTSCSPDQLWSVLPPKPGVGKNTYTLKRSASGSGQIAPGESIVLTFANVPVNNALGTTVVEVAEVNGSGTGSLSYALAKFPYGFWFAGLRATDPVTRATVSQVEPGKPVRLEWDGSVTNPASYRIRYATNAGPQVSTPEFVNQWDSPGLHEDTVFNVEVLGHDELGELPPVLTTTVSVRQPDLSVSSINLAGTDLAGELATIGKSLVPKGTIVMWSGSAAQIPPGWALCNGANGTPDLCNQFILGADPDGGKPAGTTGGSATHGHPASGTVTLTSTGAHVHGMPPRWYMNYAWEGRTNEHSMVDCSGEDVHKATTQEAGAHTHTATSTVTVEATTTLPPWFALCFIIKQI